MKKMSRAELTRYIDKTVFTYEKLEGTANILWDYMCGYSNILKWICDDHKREPLIIAISEHGVDIGDKEYVSDRLQAFGKAVHTIEITKLEEFITGKDFEIKEY